LRRPSWPSAILASTAAIAVPSYDGLWSVSIITEKGDCDRGYRYPVRILNGTLASAGDTAITITGKVAGSGAHSDCERRRTKRHRLRPACRQSRHGLVERRLLLRFLERGAARIVVRHFGAEQTEEPGTHNHCL